MFFVKWPNRPGYRVESDLSRALRTAQTMSRQTRRPVFVHTMGRTPPGTIGLVPGRAIGRVMPNGLVSNPAGLGDALTDWACSSQEFVQNWKDRVNAGINTGTQAAVLASAAAGAIGALIDRPLLGAAIGAVVGWGTHAIWTAPQRVS